MARRSNDRIMKDAPYDVRDKDAEIRAATSYVPRKSSRNGALIFNIAVFVAACALVLGAGWLATGRIGVETVVLMLLVALLAVSSVHIALSWEKVVVLRFGKLARVVGPGLYLTIPIVEHGTIRVDQRTIATPFYAEKTLTADLVPVTVDAVLFWVVWDAEKACTEVEDYYAAVSFLAQTALREAVGRSSVAEVALRRDQLDVEIKEDIEKEAAGWGVDIISVKVRDIRIPGRAAGDDVARGAGRPREDSAHDGGGRGGGAGRDARRGRARLRGRGRRAANLRTMLMQYDTVKKSKGAVVTVPSAFSDGFVDAAGKGADGRGA